MAAAKADLTSVRRRDPNSRAASGRGSVGSIIQVSFKTIGEGSNLNANVLGYGSQQSVFQYTIYGSTGNQVGAVIPVSAIPEPSTVVLAGVGLAAAGGIQWRKRILRRRPTS